MKVHYDRAADALHLRFTEDRTVESEEVSPGVVLDFDAEGRLLAIEIMPASRQLAVGALTDPVAA